MSDPVTRQYLDERLLPIEETLGVQGTRLDSHKSILDQHTATLDQHTAILDQHTAILDQHTAILDQHTAILNQHTAVLDDHTAKLDHTAQILSNLTRVVMEIRFDLPEQIKSYIDEGQRRNQQNFDAVFARLERMEQEQTLTAEHARRTDARLDRIETHLGFNGNS